MSARPSSAPGTAASSAAEVVRVGVIGAGLMGRELAAAIGRWVALSEHPVRPRLTAVCDPAVAARRWFERVDGARLSADYRELLADEELDVVYIAVPHHLHEEIYVAAMQAGRDFLGEKPFGWDLSAAQRIAATLSGSKTFVRCSSEMPFFPGAQAAYEFVRSGALGSPIEAECSLLHSSDLDVSKPINWKRQVRFCGPAGVMADLGMHVLHMPLRLGWRPVAVYACLQDLVRDRPGADGEPVRCDTFDNATLMCDVDGPAGRFPLRLEMKRIAPGEMNSWTFRAVGLEGGVCFSTRAPKTVWRFRASGGEQLWERLEVGSQAVFPTVTGGIFEFGFSDAILQMWAAFLAERAGALDQRFGCVTPEEALDSQRVLDAALRSGASGRAEPLLARAGSEPRRGPAGVS